MSNIVKLDGIKYNTESLKNKLIDNPEYFNIHDSRTKDQKSPHRESSDIWVRYGDNKDPDIFTKEHDSIWYPIALELPEVLEISFDLMAKVNGERLGGVLITKLEKGKKVYSHTDTIGWHPNYYDKFYIPIQNAKGAIFGFEDDGDIQANDGEAYWFRNDVPHWVNNDSTETRLAMVICIKPFKGIIT